MADKKNPDQIMAEYLLKGGKMLAKTCPTCYSPLFEFKGETFCAVCRENDSNRDAITDHQISSDTNKPTAEKSAIPTRIEDEFYSTLCSLLVKAREENDSKRILMLMEAVKLGAEAYSCILHGYERRDKS